MAHKDLTGKIFGSLIVLNFKDCLKKGTRWECKCECGKIVTRWGTQFCLSRTSKFNPSCGCTRSANVKKAVWTGYQDISGKYIKRLQWNARSRSILCDTGPEYWWKIFQEQKGLCALSGVPISFLNHTASIDRIDSKHGYVEGNIHVVHKIVNGMKWNFTLPDFLHMCRLVVCPKTHIEINESCSIQSHHKNWAGVGNVPRDFYTRFSRQAKKRNIVFDVEIDYLWDLFLQQHGYCAMTGLPILVGSCLYDVTASIDRKNNQVGYEPGNLQWVHKDFNSKLRRDLSLPDVLYWSSLIVNYEKGINATT